MPSFGKRSNERPASGDFEMFLKTFKDEQTRITLLEDNPEQWIDVREHFDNAMKISYPCAKYEVEPDERDAQPCVGCDYPVEHPEYADLETHFPGMNKSDAKAARKKADKGWGVRDASSKWIIPAIDPKGYVSVYKIGYNLWEDFKNQYTVLGSVTGTEWIVKRSGSGFSDTKYTPVAVPGEVRVPKYGVPTPEEIGNILGKKYTYALEKYGIEPGEEQVAPAPDPAPVPTEEQRAARAKLEGKARKDTADEAQQPDTGAAAESVDAGAAGGTPPFIPREASAGEIKDWLSEQGVEYSPKAARGALVDLAEKKLTELQGTKGWSDEPQF